MMAVGAGLVTSIVAAASSVAPLESVTRSATVCSPVVVKVCAAVCVLAVVELPVAVEVPRRARRSPPSPSVEVDVKVTSRPVCGAAGE